MPEHATEKPTLIGYVLRGQDLGGYFFRGAPDDIFCPKCRNCLDRSYAPKMLDVEPIESMEFDTFNVLPPASQRYDFCATLDGQNLFSTKFIDLIRAFSNLATEPSRISSIRTFWHYIPSETVKFDPAARKSRFGSLCELCLRHSYVVGATPAYLKSASLPDYGLFRTDLEFGSGASKSPLIIIGRKLKDEIENKNFNGLYFKEVFGSFAQDADLMKTV